MHRAPRPLAALCLLAVLAALAACTGSPDAATRSAARPTRTVDTVMGEVTVPAVPRRVVVLDTAELDSALALGVTPVGATHGDAPTGFPRYLPAARLTGVRDVGESMNPDLKAVAALEPDLILAGKVRHEDKYDALRAIAPTVMTDGTGQSWKQNFQVHAEALGRAREATRTVAAYTEHTARVTESLGGKAAAARTQVNVIRFVEGADIRIQGRRTSLGVVLADVGLGRPPVTARAAGGFSYDIGPDRIALAGEGASVLLHSTYGDPKAAGRTRTLASPAWKALPPVKAGRAFPVDDELWVRSTGYLAADRILTELQARLTRR
ncbi:ABC transporter periplasmic component [Streptomyces spiroverticillatus]|uniref:ABC transporter periplasmic component n=1 Tax=Streptomyces finlayi TaxID=67296 RepID=A0A918X1K0_9ACTN|nr:iron-siderophore ABC transporter substrate-binding protein [Streptomyces finlayi]GHA20958.1 ABC transporter periplasmic component [Streptomyces spiroverticillatus]GHD03527.1 ABC transporter periplasmic component [Streptomyces finlayi]